jgi:hypothetical protein
MVLKFPFSAINGGCRGHEKKLSRHGEETDTGVHCCGQARNYEPELASNRLGAGIQIGD